MRILLAEVKLYVLAATVAVVALLAGATGARGQGVAGETYQTKGLSRTREDGTPVAHDEHRSVRDR